ncbi:ferredoxin-NADP reductase [Neorhizobium alkalisoli]|uniref:Ferredoxin-NADP reductase n=2 Tax=Neorhizobium alkalisoli TaxID=528178 RepID=A0A561R830_9HYPH|nr:ferredoxin-NADP reductase [Neorhizobium alkalisoli]
MSGVIEMDMPEAGDNVAVRTSESAKELLLTCIGVRDETPTIKTFSFQAETPFGHEAGQALTLVLDIDGVDAFRTFSISSPPGTDRFEITIKAHNSAGATAWMHRMVAPGSCLKARPPRGHFTLSKRRSDRIAFVSAGSGATPLMAMLAELATLAPDADVSWVHAARDASEILFAERLAELQRAMPNLQVSIVISRPGPGWTGYRGRLSRRMMSVMVPDLARRDVFCCGPSAFMQEVRLIHAAEGGDKAGFHSETFGGVVAPVLAKQITEDDTGLDASESFTLTVGTRTLDIRSDESVLQASLRQGVIIPCGCGQGMCGTCLVKKLGGEVETSYQGGITPEEESEGYILACSAKPLGNLAISI